MHGATTSRANVVWVAPVCDLKACAAASRLAIVPGLPHLALHPCTQAIQHAAYQFCNGCARSLRRQATIQPSATDPAHHRQPAIGEAEHQACWKGSAGVCDAVQAARPTAQVVAAPSASGLAPMHSQASPPDQTGGDQGAAMGGSAQPRRRGDGTGAGVPPVSGRLGQFLSWLLQQPPLASGGWHAPSRA